MGNPLVQRTARRTLSLFCDFDGTITDQDVTDSLLEAFAGPAWHQVEARWLEGHINARECMATQIAMIDADRFAIDRHLAEIQIDPTFPEFVRSRIAAGHHIYIVSDGIDYAIRRILLRHGLDNIPILSNRLQQESETSYTLRFDNAAEHCPLGTCKCAAIADLSAGETIVIGDGRSDYCMAKHADTVFAKGELAKYCTDQGIAYIPFDSFNDILEYMNTALDEVCL